MADELNVGDWQGVAPEFATLNAITAALSRSLQVAPVLDMIVRGAVELSGVDAGGLYEWAADQETMVVNIGYRLSPAFLQAIRDAHIRPGQGAVGQAVVQRELVELPDVRLAADYPFQSQMQREGYCSVLAVPIIHGQDVVGAICLWRSRPGETARPVRALLKALADQGAVALGNARLYEQAQRRASELAALVEVGRDITATLDLPRVLERIAHHAWRILETDDCDLYLLQPDGQTLQAIVSQGPYAAETMAEPTLLGEGIVGHIAQTGVAEMINHMELDPRAVQIPGTPDSEPQAMICAPLLSKGSVIGAMALSRLGDRHFSQADLNFLVNLAQQATIAIENAHLYQAARQAEADARRRADLLATVHQLALDVSSELALDRLLETVIRRAMQLLGREAGSLWLYDETAGRLNCVVSIANWPEFTAIGLRPGQGLNGRVFATGEPIVVDDYWSWEGAEPAFTGEPVGPAMCVPLLWKGRVRGTLQVSGRLASPPFSTADATAVMLLAAQAAIAIENAGLYDAVRQRAQDLALALARQQEVDRLQAEFIQNVSHELRTPLTLIQGYAEMLNDGELGPLPEDHRGPVATITRQVHTLRALVEDIMMILQVDALAMHLVPMAMADLVRAAVGDFSALARQSGLSLSADVEPDLPLVAGDTRHLRKVVDNLISNAVKFTPAGGRIHLTAFRQASGVAVRVADTGIGIPPTELQKIFQRFYQVDGSLRRRYGGTGLGLALVQDILDKHGGWIEAHSEGIPGKGSAFTFWLPPA